MQAATRGLSGMVQLMSRKSTPACSRATAISQVVARSLPPSTNSSADSRTPSGRPGPQTALMPAMISSTNLILFSSEPPYRSARRFR